MKTTVISILILSFFSSNVAGVKPSRGLLPARRPELHPLASKELPPIPGICLMVMVPAKSTEKPRQVCKAVEGSEYKVGFHIPSKVYEESCDAQSPCINSGNDCFVRLIHVPGGINRAATKIVGATCR